MTRQYTRKRVGENKNVANKNIRKGAGRRMRLDSSLYEAKYPNQKLMWITDSGSDLDWWIQQGAECVTRDSVARKTIEGVNDKLSSGYVTVPSGTKPGGGVELSYLLRIDPDIYEELVTIPDAERQADIMQAMRLGGDQSGLERHLKGGGSIGTYAPNLPTGTGTGYNEIR